MYLMLALAALFMLGAVSKKTVMRGAFSYGRGPGYRPTIAQRVILFLIGIVLVLGAFKLV